MDVSLSAIKGYGQGGGGGGGGGADLNRLQLSVGQGQGVLTVGKAALLLHIACSSPMRVRLYTTLARRSADAVRARNVIAPQGSGLLFEFIASLDVQSAPLSPGVLVYNLDVPVTNVIYYNIELDSETQGFATLTYIKLEE